MTVITCIAAVDMCRRLASCRDIIVAGSAGAGNLRVIDGIHGRPRIRVVAILTDICRQYV